VNEDCLKLTTYFGERRRTGDRFVADVLLDVYGRHGVQTSVLLRGTEGFGVKHHLRTDRLLTLSEDLPLVSVAVDARPRIEALLDEVTSLEHQGLVTLERARMLTGDIGSETLPEELHEATKLTVYVGRQERVGSRPAFVAVCDLFQRHGIAGATALLGVDGTAHGTRERARFFARNAEVPMMIIAVGPGERVAGVLPQLGGLLRRPLLTLERVRVCKRDGHRLAEPGSERWQKLMIYSSDHHVALVRRLRSSGARGVTCLRAVWGFHGDHAPHGDRLLQLRRRAPVVTVVIDTPEGIARSFEIVDDATRESGLVTCEPVTRTAGA
jgi:PII-like signaling protein